MASSKFSSPFFKKSPLHGAYASGADGMVTVSDAEHFAKLQGDAAGIVDKAYTKDKCDDPNVVQYTENSVLKKCPKKTSTDEDPLTLADVRELERINAAATTADEQIEMDDINSTGEYLESEKKKDAAELEQQKTDFTNNPGIMNKLKKFKWLT